MERISSKIFLFALFLLLFTIPLSRAANNFSIALLILSWIGLQPWGKNTFSNIKRVPLGWISILLLSSYAASFLWTDDKSTGLKEFEVLAPMLIFPLAMTAIGNQNRLLERILEAFVLTISLIVMISIVIAILRTLNYGWYYRDPFSTVVYNNFFYHGFASGAAIHPSFFSLFCGFSIIVLLNPDNLGLRFSKPHRITLISILCFGMVLLQAVMISFATIVAIGLIILIKSLSSAKTGVYLMLILLFVTALLGILIIKFDIRQDLISYDLESGTGWNSINLRLALWEVSLDAIRERPLWGVGIGDAQNVLLEHYKKANFYFGAYNNYQPHNQFILSWLMAGIPSVVLISVMFGTMLFRAIKKLNFLYLGLTIIFILFCLTDIPLSRNKPLVFLMFFTFLFEYSAVNKLSTSKSGTRNAE